MRIGLVGTVVIGVFIWASAPVAQAELIVHDLDIHFGSDPSTGPVRIAFNDFGTAGSVFVSMDTSGLTSSSEFVKEWYFNFDGDASVALTFFPIDLVDISGVLSVTTSSTQSLQADGDGKYNIRYNFAESAGAARFTMGETVVTKITGAGILAADFDIIAAPGGGFGPFFSAAKINATGTGSGSDWLGSDDGFTIPEPATAVLLVLSAAAIALRFRRKRT